jgi:hypothetical protein
MASLYITEYSLALTGHQFTFTTATTTTITTTTTSID